MRYIILILLLFSLSGCSPDKENIILNTAICQVKDMIDQSKFNSRFIIVNELSVTDLGVIFSIMPADIPFIEGIWEPPYKVIKYKGKFICLISPMSPDVISKKVLFESTHYPLNDDFNRYEDMWYMGVSANGKEYSIVSTDGSKLAYRYYIFPQLWKYIFRGYNEKNSPRYILGEYDLNVDQKYQTGNTIEKHIEQIRGMIYFTNPNDEYFIKKNSKGFFATLNGKDTLKYIVEDTLLHHFWVESIPNHSFFRNFPATDTWEYLHRLLSDSTFYFQKEEKRYTREAIPVDMNFMIDVRNSKGCIIHTFYKKGVNDRWKNNIEDFSEWNNEFSPNTK